jgi:hypothetical protein
MPRAIRSEAELAQILARPGFRVASQIGGEIVNTEPAKPMQVAADVHRESGPLFAMVALCRAAGLPEPIPEYRFHPTRRWRFDYCWPLRKLALEVEGGIWTQGRHTRGSGALADLQKYSEAAIDGWRIIYCTPADLASTGLDRVRKALEET